jgi:hypothetical protein
MASNALEQSLLFILTTTNSLLKRSDVHGIISKLLFPPAAMYLQSNPLFDFVACAKLTVVSCLQKCGMYTIEAEIGLSQMEKALAEQYCEQQAENFTPSDPPSAETWVLYHQRKAKAESGSEPCTEKRALRAKSPEKWVLYHQRAAESGADARDAKPQTLDDATSEGNAPNEKNLTNEDAAKGGDQKWELYHQRAVKAEPGGEHPEEPRTPDDVIAPGQRSAEPTTAGEQPANVSTLVEERNPSSLYTLMSESQTWVLYHQREEGSGDSEAAGREEVTAVEAEETAGGAAPASDVEDVDEDVAILEVGAAS